MDVITPEMLIEQGKAFQEMILPMLAREDVVETLKDTPYVRRLSREARRTGRAEGRMEGRAEGRAEGRVEGRMEGRMEGEHEAMVKMVARILAIRFGVELDHFAAELNQLSVSVLETLSEVALTVDSLDDFELKLKELEDK